MPAHSIASKATRLLSYIHSNISAAADACHEELLAVALRMCTLNPQSVFLTCPVTHRDFFYLSQNCQHLFGYDAEHMQTVLRDPQLRFSQVHDADAEHLSDCMNFVRQFFENEAPGDPQHFRCFFYYRVRHADGKYIFLQDQKAVFPATNQTIFYSLLRAMDDGVPFRGVKLEIYREHPDFKKLVDYNPAAAKNKLTSREAELLSLMRRGLTTKEMAQHLNLSSHTIRNTKSRMFSKYSVNNSIELLNVAG